MTTSLPEQVAAFWDRVDRRGKDDCWPWTGGRVPSGYGRFSVKRKSRPASQVAWEIANDQPFPKGLLACHTCDNPICVNPGHIWPGTQSQNIRDCIRKGRHRNNRRTHCKHGHELTPENRKPSTDGTRCRTCANIAQSAYEQRMLKTKGSGWRNKNK